MYLVISTNIFAALPIEAALQRISRVGIKNIEIHALHLAEAKDKTENVIKWVKKYGLNVPSVHSTTMNSDFLGKTEPEFKQKYKDYYSPLFNCAKNLGAKIFVDHLDKANFHKKKEYNSLKGRIIENSSLLTELAASYEITIAMENSSGDNCLYSPGQFKEILEKVNHPNFKMNLDIGHSLCNDINPQKFIDIVGEHIVNLHTGNFKMTELIESLKNIGYKGAIVLEHEEEKLRDAFKNILEELKESGFDVNNVHIDAMPILNRLRIPKGWRLQ